MTGGKHVHLADEAVEQQPLSGNADIERIVLGARAVGGVVRLNSVVAGELLSERHADSDRRIVRRKALVVSGARGRDGKIFRLERRVVVQRDILSLFKRERADVVRKQNLLFRFQRRIAVLRRRLERLPVGSASGEQNGGDSRGQKQVSKSRFHKRYSP